MDKKMEQRLIEMMESLFVRQSEGLKEMKASQERAEARQEKMNAEMETRAESRQERADARQEIFNYGCLVTAAFGQTRHSIKGMHMQIILRCLFKAFNITYKVFNISWKVVIYLTTCISGAFVKCCQMSHHLEKIKSYF
jgi:hypothetical protein